MARRKCRLPVYYIESEYTVAQGAAATGLAEAPAPRSAEEKICLTTAEVVLAGYYSCFSWMRFMIGFNGASDSGGAAPAQGWAVE
jgi:hypothetical protein